jgi:hypothetical protein
MLYGDYRFVAEVQAPFSIKEEISGQLTWGIQLDTLEANTGVSDQQFELN